ncbi:MAG: long-chain fatty acid--CoA ligase [Bacteroidales bacterium]|jgi:long-chain acyl-CoA synthetase|nr:long-chain fatty acid--CoA ligase [Bacteroidales bacterium]
MLKITRLFDLLELYRNEFKSLTNVFNVKKEGKWISYSASDYCEYSRLISLGLLSMGVKEGTKIATVMLNCPEWNFFDMGIMQAGAVQVPIYPTVSEDTYRYIFVDAQVEYLIVSNKTIYERLSKIVKDITSLKAVYSIEPVPGLRSWTEILEQGKNFSRPDDLETIKKSIPPCQMVSIIYTSGTTGRPKGVMLSHHNFVTNYQAMKEIPPLEYGNRILSFLPLCHVYERTASYVFQSFGVSIFYVQDLDELADYIGEVKPHAFAAVPRVLEKIYNRIVARGRAQRLPIKVLFFWALRQGHKYEINHARGWFYEIKLWVANLLIFTKWRKALGGNIKFIVSGSAALHPRLTRIFWAARIPVLEAYGLTETSPGIALFRFDPGGIKFGTVGPLLKNVQVKIADDGEILVKSPGVMMGYFNRPEKTAEVMDKEGWFHTGDIGVMEDGKYLRITDRKKEIFKTSTGRYIAPQVIEQKFKESPFIENIMVIGENRPYAAALIIPNFEYLMNWCEVKHVGFGSREKVIRNPRIIKRIKQEVDRFNQDLGQTEKIKKFRLMACEWSVSSGELSPTLKLRRKYILEQYKKIIDETYRSPEYNYRSE